MPFRIVRNDITKMTTEAVVNTANTEPIVGSGCDHAIYQAAGYEKLLAYRRGRIGAVPEGQVFLTPGFDLPAKYIIHAVSPLYRDGKHEEEELLRSCYRNSLKLAEEEGISSIAFPLISTGGFGYPKEEGMRIAVDEIHAFLLHSNMEVCLVVFDPEATGMGRNLSSDLESYIDDHYAEARHLDEYSFAAARTRREGNRDLPVGSAKSVLLPEEGEPEDKRITASADRGPESEEDYRELKKKLADRIDHRSDSFSQYLLYLISQKGMSNADVYKRAIVDKKVFSKIKNHPDYHPQKLTALCLCIGARLNTDQTRDLLARAGYALSPYDKTDIIFSYFIENGIYDMIELDIQLEEHGLPCIIA